MFYFPCVQRTVAGRRGDVLWSTAQIVAPRPPQMGSSLDVVTNTSHGRSNAPATTLQREGRFPKETNMVCQSCALFGLQIILAPNEAAWDNYTFVARGKTVAQPPLQRISRSHENRTGARLKNCFALYSLNCNLCIPASSFSKVPSGQRNGSQNCAHRCIYFHLLSAFFGRLSVLLARRYTIPCAVQPLSILT